MAPDDLTEEWVFRIETEYPYNGMLSELLRRNGIVFVTRGRMGAGIALKAGLGAERTQFYVPPDLFPRANTLVSEILPST